MASDERFPCIVCQSLANSIFELHHHQKCCHTSEELSMSVIYLVNYMCLQQNMALRLREASNRLVPPGYLADYRNQKICIQASGKVHQIQRFTEFETDVQSPIDYTSSQTSYLEPKTASGTKVEEINQMKRCVTSSSGLSCDERPGKDGINTPSWEMELGKVEEINDETFLRSVAGICQDLKSIVRAPAVGTKRGKSGLPPMKMTAQKCHNKKSNKRKFSDQKNLYTFDPNLCYKNVGEAYRRGGDPKFGDEVTAYCSSKNDGTPIKLASFEQTFQHLKKKKVNFSNEINSINDHASFQGSVDTNFPLQKEGLTLRGALSAASCEHGMERKITMLDSNFRQNLTKEPSISGTKNFVGISDIHGKKIEGI